MRLNRAPKLLEGRSNLVDDGDVDDDVRGADDGHILVTLLQIQMKPKRFYNYNVFYICNASSVSSFSSYVRA